MVGTQEQWGSQGSECWIARRVRETSILTNQQGADNKRACLASLAAVNRCLAFTATTETCDWRGFKYTYSSEYLLFESPCCNKTGIVTMACHYGSTVSIN